jgi:WD40 repeat protein
MAILTMTILVHFRVLYWARGPSTLILQCKIQPAALYCILQPRYMGHARLVRWQLWILHGYSESLSVLEGHYSFVRAVCFHPTRELCVSASAGSYFRVWDAASISMLPSRVSPKPVFTRALVRSSLIHPVT